MRRARSRLLAACGALLWSVPLSPVATAGDHALLSACERQRARKYRRDEDRAAFVVARAALRRVLGDHLGADPGGIALGRYPCPGCGSDRHGPPRILSPAAAPSFSFSRSAGRALVAVVPSGAVGVDIEALRPIDVAKVGKLCLSEREYAYVVRLPREKQEMAFHRTWARKEAVTKAAGVGIVVDLRAVDVDPERAGPVTVRCAVGERMTTWTVTDVTAGPRFVAALALPGARTSARSGRAPRGDADGGTQAE